VISNRQEEPPAKYFYAEDEAQLYDATIRLSQPQYDILHQTLLDLLRYHFSAFSEKESSEVSGHILDLGCGTGMEGLGVLEAFPNIRLIAIDSSDKMIVVFKKKGIRLMGEEAFSRRCELIEMDVREKGFAADGLKPFITRDDGSEKFKAVISVVALHHLTFEEKEKVYTTIHAVLEPGGLFLNGDLYSYQSLKLRQYAQDHIEKYNILKFSNPDISLNDVSGLTKNDLERILQLYLKHLREENRPLPIEVIKKDNERSGNIPNYDSEAQLLRQIGFSEVECPYRYFQGGIIWAMKEKER